MGARDTLAFTTMNSSIDGHDKGVRLRVALGDFVEGSGARMAALMDRSGELLAQAGFAGADRATDLAALVAGVHAASRRMSEITGSGTVEEMVTLGGEGRLVVRSVSAERSSVLLLSVFDEPGEDPRVRPAIDALEGALAVRGLQPRADEDLAASLLDRVDRTFQAE